MAERVEILKIEVDTQQTAQSLEQVEAEILSLRDAQKNLNQQIKKNGGANKEQVKQLVAIQQALRAQRKQRRVLIKDLDTTNNSLQAQRNELAKLVAQRNQLDRSTEEGAIAFNALNQEIKDLNDSIKASEEAGGDFRRSVGNYAKGAREAVASIDGLGGAVESLNTVLKANIFVLVINSLIQLGRLFSQTEEGSKQLEKATAFLSGAFGALVKQLEVVGKRLIEAFEDPQQALKDFGDALVKDVTNRFKGLIDLISSAGSALKALVTQDFEALKKAGSEAGTAITQVVSGLDELQQEAAKNNLANFTKEINDAAQAALNFAQAQQRVIQANQALSISIANLANEEQRLNDISADGTRSLQERTAANIAAQEAAESRARAELQIAKNNEGITQRELQQAKARSASIQDQREIQQRLADATSERITAEGELAAVQRANAQERRQLLLDELDLELDVLIDGLDNQKTINERKISDEKIAFNERRALLEQTRRLQNESFTEQIAIIQSQTKQQIDANELLATSDAKLLNERIKGLELSDESRTRLLEIIREQRTATQDLNEAERDLDSEGVERRNRELQAKIDILEVQQQQETSTEKQTEIERQQSELQLEILTNQLLAKEISYNEYAARVAEVEAGITSTEATEASKRVAIQKAAVQQQIQASAALLGAIRGLAEEGSAAYKALSIAQVTASYVAQLQNIFTTNSSPTQPGNAVTFGGAGLAVSALQAATATATYVANIAKISAAAGGGDFVTSKPTLLLVGDNPGGRELVSVKPLSGKGQTKVAEGSGLNRVAMAGGGNLLFDGGLSTSQAAEPVNNQFAIQNAIKAAMLTMPSPVVSVQDINVQQKKVQVKDTTATL